MRKFFYNKKGESFSIETHKGLSSFGIYYEIGGYDNNKTIFIGLLFFRLWCSWGKTNLEKKYGFDISENKISIWYGDNDYFGENKGNKVFNFWWNKITDLFFGKEKRFWGDEKDYGKFDLKMEQGDEYIVKVKGQQLYGWRPRWFGKKYWFSYIVTPDRTIPYQGKGENSWDCGDTGTNEMIIGYVKSPEEACIALKNSCEESRKKYGIVENIQMKLS